MNFPTVSVEPHTKQLLEIILKPLEDRSEPAEAVILKNTIHNKAEAGERKNN